MFSLTGIESTLDDRNSSFEMLLEKSEISQLIHNVNEKHEQINDYIITELKENESLIDFTKWGSYLPLEYQKEIVKERYFDFTGAIELINNMNWIAAK